MLKSKALLAVCFVGCLFLISCGSSSSSTSSSAPQGTITSGNWSIAATSAASTTAEPFFIGGSLAQTGSSVAGTMHVFGSGCFPTPSVNMSFAGSFSGDTLTMKSVAIDGQVVTVKATGTGASLTGTYSVAGGCADGDHGTVAATYFPPVTGTWTSTSSQGNSTVSISASLTQASTADVNGVFPLSGSVTFTGLACPTGGTVSYLPQSDWSTSDIVGNNVLITVNNAVSGKPELYFSGTVNNTTTISASYSITDTTCPGWMDSYVQFTKQ